MKICHITTVHKQNDSRIFHKECKSLVEKGFDVTLLVINGESEIVDGVEIISTSIPPVGRVKRILTSGDKIFQKAVEVNAEVYHLHDPELLRIAVKLKKKTGAKVVYDSHEDLPKQVLDKHWIPSLLRTSLSKLIYRYEMKKASKIDGVVSVTEKICNRFKLVNKHVVLVSNFPVLSEMKENYQPDVKKLDRTICYIGGLFPTRGIKELVQALEYCDAKLLLAGNFSSSEFEAEVKALKGWGKVEFFGYVDRPKIVEILSSSHIGIVTLHPTESYKEALPIKLFEYMSAELPVIASDFEQWYPLVLDNKCGVVVDPMKPKEIAAKIDYLLSNEDLAMEMGKAGLEAARSKYTWESQALKLINFYNEITA